MFAVFDHMHDGVGCYESDGTIVYANPTMCRILGSDLAAMVGHSLWEVFPAAIDGPFHRALPVVVATGVPQRYVAYSQHLAGWFANELMLVEGRVWLIARDITAEKRATARLEVLTEASRVFSQAALDLPSVFDEVARHMATLLGDFCVIRLRADDGGSFEAPVAVWDAVEQVRAVLQQLRSVNAREAIGPGLLAKLEPVIANDLDPAVIAKRFAPDHAELVEPLGIHALIVAPLVTRGRVVGLLSVGRRRGRTAAGFVAEDLSLVVELAERAALVVTNAREMQRTDEFLALLGHELRNPLAPLVTALDLAELRGAPPEPATLAAMRRQVQHMQRLVDDLLDVAKVARGKLELDLHAIDLAEVVALAVEMAAPLLEAKSHRFAVKRTVNAAAIVLGDRERLAQVVANLLTNAAKYTDPHGEITVSVARRGESSVLEVRDSGMGITADLLPRIFERFVQAPQASDRALGGLGLGLALVKNVVELHHGTVTAASDGPGKGSTFTVRLPFHAAKVPAPVIAPPSPTSDGRRILLVDDNADAAAILAELLAVKGHEVHVANDAHEALDALAAFTPEIAVLDLGLPIMDGYELAAELRARLPDVGLIALTGYGHESAREKTRACGFEHHLVKPVSPRVLLEAIQSSGSRIVSTGSPAFPP